VRDILRQQLYPSQIKKLREAYNVFQADSNIENLIRTLRQLLSFAEPLRPVNAQSQATTVITRDDLRLICFDHVVS
jgi:hypothetical protein